MTRELHIAMARWASDNPHIPWKNAGGSAQALYIFRANFRTINEELTASRIKMTDTPKLAA